MKRLPRILLNAATILSLVLFVAAVVTWVWSNRTARYASYWRGNDRYLLMAFGGRIGLGRSMWKDASAAQGWSFHSFRPAGASLANLQTGSDTPAHRLGFGVAKGGVSPTVSFETLVAPIWSIAALTVALPVVRATTWLRRRRRRLAGTCPACGYDLRATPDRCPECGTLPAVVVKI